MIAQDPDELFDVLRADGRPTGVAKARHAVHRDGDWHRSLHVWVAGVGDEGIPFLMMQRRGLAKDTWPGALDATVGGHFRTGEQLEQVVREVEEEIGIAVTPADLRWFGTRVCVNDAPSLGIVDHELQEVFLLRDDRPLITYQPNAIEVDALVRAPGINPDIEIGAFLTERSGFQHAPPLLGSVQYRGQDGEAVSIAVLQTFVPSVGDAWTMTLCRLTSLVGAAEDDLAATSAFERAVHWAALLGGRTGQLHVALASDSDDPAFAPDPVTDEDIRSWQAALDRAGRRRRADLAGHPILLSNPVMAALAEQQLAPDALERLAKGFDALRGTVKTRVHGDYHLGQVLQTVDGDAVILDFEGEPSRPIEERRLKTSPLKDVAGMLRSFSYARVATERASDDAGRSSSPRALDAWERAAREAFLVAYRHEAAKADVPLIPESLDAFQRVTRAWEADKALYEIHYELNNRPDWLAQVLETLAIS